MTVKAEQVEAKIREAEQLLGRYRYDNRSLADSRQKGLADAENLLTEARIKVQPRLVPCQHCDGTGKVPDWSVDE